MTGIVWTNLNITATLCVWSGIYLQELGVGWKKRQTVFPSPPSFHFLGQLVSISLFCMSRCFLLCSYQVSCACGIDREFSQCSSLDTYWWAAFSSGLCRPEISRSSKVVCQGGRAHWLPSRNTLPRGMEGALDHNCHAWLPCLLLKLDSGMGSAQFPMCACVFCCHCSEPASKKSWTSLSQHCACLAHCERPGSENATFLAIYWVLGGFWDSQMHLFSRNSCTGPFKYNKPRFCCKCC